ncbi:hypothetical protein [Clostridium saccharoperbutylacetonicum]|jgi:hypothetical protein
MVIEKVKENFKEIIEKNKNDKDTLRGIIRKLRDEKAMWEDDNNQFQKGKLEELQFLIDYASKFINRNA